MRIKGEVVFRAILLCVFLAGALLSMELSGKARILPLVVMIGGTGLSAVLLVSGLRETAREQEKEKSAGDTDEKTELNPRGQVTIILWVLAFLILVLLIGFWVAIPVFNVAFLLGFGRERVKTAIIYTAAVWLAMYGIFHVFLVVRLYGGILGLSFL